MNCQSFESIVNDLARQQIMDANLREQAFGHLGECAACGLRLRDERALSHGLRLLAGEVNGAEASPHIEEELRAAFRKHKFAESRLRSMRWFYGFAAAAAAVLLIVLGVVAMRWRSASPSAQIDPSVRGQQSGEIVGETTSSRTAVKSPVTVEESRPLVRRNQEPKLASRRPKRRATPSMAQSAASKSPAGNNALVRGSATTVAENFNGNEIATDFLPVGYTSPMNFQDGGQVVRVELPRSALATFGFPVNMNRANERVKADVLVGTDGQARAIRFVQ